MAKAGALPASAPRSLKPANTAPGNGGAPTPAPGRVSPSEAPAVPALPHGEAAIIMMDEDETETRMRAVVAYNKYHVRRVMKEDTRWFSGWSDKPIHERQPLAIRKPDSKDDLLTYVAARKKNEAIISFKGAGTYKGGGNAFWLNPFIDKSNAKLVSIAGDPPVYSQVVEASQSYALDAITQQGMTRPEGKVTAGKEARIKFPHVFTTYSWGLSQYDADHFDSSLPLISGHVGLWAYH